MEDGSETKQTAGKQSQEEGCRAEKAPANQREHRSRREATQQRRSNNVRAPSMPKKKKAKIREGKKAAQKLRVRKESAQLM